MKHSAIITGVTHRCAYCMRGYSGRARCCSQWCERKVRGKSAYVTRSRRDAVARVLAGVIKTGRNRKRWRDIAMSPEPDAQLAVIFGIDPDSRPIPRHGETLDAGIPPKAPRARRTRTTAETPSDLFTSRP